MVGEMSTSFNERFLTRGKHGKNGVAEYHIGGGEASVDQLKIDWKAAGMTAPPGGSVACTRSALEIRSMASDQIWRGCWVGGRGPRVLRSFKEIHSSR